jgi:hypothetical protein
MPDNINLEENMGPGDAVVTYFNVISTHGKELKQLGTGSKSWNFIVLSESMGLFEKDTQFISGEVGILSRINIVDELRISGGETIQLRLATPQKKEIELIAKVYDINIIDYETANRAIVLKFCSPEKMTSDKIKFNRTYRKVPYSDMAADIFSTLNSVGDKKLDVEPTKNVGTLIVNNKSPLAALNMITKTSISDTYLGADYVFFETLDKMFKFRSIESMVDPDKNEPVITYYYDAPPKSAHALSHLVRIRNYKLLRMPNQVTDVQSGMYSSRLISNDLVKRQIKTTVFDYDEHFKKTKSVDYNEINGETTSLTNNKDYSKVSDSRICFLPKSFRAFDVEDNPGSYEDFIEQNYLVRNSQLLQHTAIRLQITVPGDSQRRVGEVVDVMFPSSEEKYSSSRGEDDMLLSGRYLVAKIKHVFTSKQNGYYTVLLLVKGTYKEPLPESK